MKRAGAQQATLGMAARVCDPVPTRKRAAAPSKLGSEQPGVQRGKTVSKSRLQSACLLKSWLVKRREQHADIRMMCGVGQLLRMHLLHNSAGLAKHCAVMHAVGVHNQQQWPRGQEGRPMGRKTDLAITRPQGGARAGTAPLQDGNAWITLRQSAALASAIARTSYIASKLKALHAPPHCSCACIQAMGASV